jgi:hypothetical protein
MKLNPGMTKLSVDTPLLSAYEVTQVPVRKCNMHNRLAKAESYKKTVHGAPPFFIRFLF